MLEAIRKELGTLQAAPFSAIALICIGAGGGFAASKWGYERELAALRAENVLALKQAGSGEKGVLSSKQSATLSRELAREVGEIFITRDVAALDGLSRTKEFVDAFDGAGWKIAEGFVVGPGVSSKSGVVVLAQDLAALTPAESAVLRALDAARIEYELRPGNPGNSTLLVTIATGKP